MKKTLFTICLLPLALGLAACGGASSSEESESTQSLSSEERTSSSSQESIDQESVDKLKALLAKQDLSPIYDKLFTCTFYQNYDVFARNHDEQEWESRYYTYRGAGMFGCLYEVTQEAYAEVEALESKNSFDYLARSNRGSYGFLQTADLASYHYETDGEETNESFQNMHFLQNVEARFTENDVQVVNSLSYQDKTKEGPAQRQYFNGIIGKEILFDAITVRAFSDIFARTNLYDGQRSCETIDRIYFDLLKELSGESDEELGQFIIQNDIRFEEDEENILVRFKVEDSELRSTLTENDIIPGCLEGTLTYDKESGDFDAFHYKIVYLTHEEDDSTGNASTATMEFSAEGKSQNKKWEGGFDIDPNPTSYDDAETFLDDVVREVIPPLF